MLAIADEAGIRDLDRLKDATARARRPATHRSRGRRARSSRRARPIYYFNAALHADETGSTEAVLELAYRLAVSEQPMIRRIREQLVVLVNPVSNPDGRDKVVEWFYRFLKGKTDYAALPRQSPPYWSKYAFVDINRDAHQQVHEATKAVHRMFHEWHPTVVHDLHEAIALMLTWNGTGPYNPHLDPITHGEFLELSFHEVRAMTALGMPGVWTWKFGEAFGHHYLDSVAMNHNALGRGYETFGNATAETVRRGARRLRRHDGVVPARAPARAELHLVRARQRELQRDGSARRARLHGAQREGDAAQLLPQGLQLVAQGRGGSRPTRFVIPEDQGDRARVADMVRPARRARRSRWAGPHAPLELDGRPLPRRQLRGAARPALPELRGGPAHAAALPEGRRPALRRHLVGAARALSAGGEADRRPGGARRSRHAAHRAAAT